MTLGENIIFYRRQKGITQEQLADIMQVSRQSVSKWENNETVPELQKLIKLADVLEVEMDELCGRKSGGKEAAAEPKSDGVHKSTILKKVIVTLLVVVLLLAGTVTGAAVGYSIGRSSATDEKAKELYHSTGVADVSISSIGGSLFTCTVIPEVYVEDFEYTILVSNGYDSYEVPVTFEDEIGTAEIGLQKYYEYDLTLKVKNGDVVRSVALLEELEVDSQGGISYIKCE